MSGKILSATAIFLLISSSQAAFSDDLTEYVTPWVNAALSVKPLLVLIMEEVFFIRKEILGMEPTLLESIYRDTDQKLSQFEAQASSKGAKDCVSDLKAVHRMSTEKFQTDGLCLKMQYDKGEQIILDLIKVIFPVEPTPECPIPILCKIDLRSYSPRNLKQAVSVLKDVHQHGVNILKFIVYLKKDITACRSNPEIYTALSNYILRAASACAKV